MAFFYYTNFCTLVSRIDPQKIFPRTFVDRMIIRMKRKPNIDETSCQKFEGAKYIWEENSRKLLFSRLFFLQIDNVTSTKRKINCFFKSSSSFFLTVFQQMIFKNIAHNLLSIFLSSRRIVSQQPLSPAIDQVFFFFDTHPSRLKLLTELIPSSSLSLRMFAAWLDHEVRRGNRWPCYLFLSLGWCHDNWADILSRSGCLEPPGWPEFHPIRP